MKVQTHIRAGELVALAPPFPFGKNTPVHSTNGNGQGWLDELRQFLRLELKPWFTDIYYQYDDADRMPVPMTSASLKALDSASQSFARRWLDPWFDNTRDRQRLALDANLALGETTPAEKLINRYILVSLGTIAATIAHSLFFPPLLLAALAGAFYMTLPIYMEAYDDLKHTRRIKSAFVYGLGITGAWLGGFFVAGALGNALYFLAKKVLYKTEDHARRTLVSVFEKVPRSVWLVADGVEVEVPLEHVQEGDILAVQAGQPIPVDGTITRGLATIDQHTLTGEAQPVERGVGDAVLATTVVLTGSIRIRVDKAGKETAAAQIGEILSRTGSYQLSIESKAVNTADRLALPELMLSGAALLAVGYQGAISVLTGNLGWNVKLTGPLAMLNYLNLISRLGVLIKDGRSLELLHGIDTLVFDKTGTLTLEQLHVAQVHAFNGFDTDQILALAAAAEQRQSHPIARAILQAAQERDLPLTEIDEAQYQVGFGLQVQTDGETVRVGSSRFMQLEGIAVPEQIVHLHQMCGEQGHSLVLVAIGDALGGALELHATLRPEAKRVIERLRHRKLNLYILSGDQEAPTRRLAHALGIEHYIAGVLPEGKAAVIEQLQAEGKAVCFVGDGINDAIALKKARVSISLRGATTVAVDAAQIVLMDSSLEHLPDLLDLAGEFHTNLKLGIGWAIIPDALVVTGVFLAHTGIYFALIIGNLGLLGGIATALLPLLRHRNKSMTPLELSGTAS